MVSAHRVLPIATSFVLACLAGCGGGRVAVVLRDLDGAVCEPASVSPGNVHVIVFVSQECPIANAYAPTLRRLNETFREQPVHMFLVHVDPDLSVAAAKAHCQDYALPGTVVLDGRQDLAAVLGATITPEAVVLRSDGIVYRGRIDDQWRSLGVRAPVAGSEDLRLAVLAALRGERVPTPHPKAVGCLLPEPAR